MQPSEIILEFDKIKEILGQLACSQGARARLMALAPALSEKECRARLQNTTEARKILDALGTPPLSSMEEINKLIALLKAESLLHPSQFLAVSQFLSSVRRVKNYLKRGEYMGLELAGYGRALVDLPDLNEEIERCIRGDLVDSGASSALRDVRRKMEHLVGQIKARLNSLLQNNKAWFSDSFVATRNGRLTLPVKREYRAQVTGTVVDLSSSGGTVFIEPAAVTKMQSELNTLQVEEENEVRKILYTLTALCQDCLPALQNDRDTLEALDFAFAKGKLSAGMGAIAPEITTQRQIIIRNGRHPLIEKDQCIPLNFELGGDTLGIVITGPNTGGKTVALKTVGLLSMMAQSGLHVPLEAGSRLCLHGAYLSDIGDGQSIAQNLSTFSSHMVSVLSILKSVHEESLVLLDELGSGTDPVEGMGIAIAVLDVLREKKCLFVATTHYPEVKEYAAHTSGLKNARMAFDRESLAPLYRLEIGEAGESCALHILKRLGFPEGILRRAELAAYGGEHAKAPQIISPLPMDAIAPVNLGASSAPRIQKETEPKPVSLHAAQFQLGDSVLVYPGRELGLVYAPANERGEVGVQIKGEKQRISHKRLKRHVAAENMYPEGYDFSIVFDSVENRKARHKMGKRCRPDLQITYEKEPEFPCK